MKTATIEMTEQWLKDAEVESDAPAVRSFGTRVGGVEFLVSVEHLPSPEMPYAGSLGEEARKPEDKEVLQAVLQAFLRSLPTMTAQRATGPDLTPEGLERSYEAYRRERAETTGQWLAGWHSLGAEEQEAWAVGCAESMRPA